MRFTPDPVLEVTTSVPDLSVRKDPHYIPEPDTPDQVQRTIPFYGEIHVFDMGINTQAQAGELRCPGSCRWSWSGGVGDPAHVAARAEHGTKQQKASDTKQTWLHTRPPLRAPRAPRCYFPCPDAIEKDSAKPLFPGSNPGAADKFPYDGSIGSVEG